MINKRSALRRYKIVSIGLDASRDWLCDFMTSQLSSVFDTSSNKHVMFEIMALLIEK